MKKPSGPRTGEVEQSLVDFAAIDRLAKIVTEYDLSEVEINLGEMRVRLARQRGSSAHASFAPALEKLHPTAGGSTQVALGAAAAAETARVDIAGAVKSPMVGTAYLRATPEAKPFVEIGTIVKVGDRLMLVEAMKTFNDIVAPRAGKVINILVADGSPVEYDQPLMIVE